MSSPQSSSTSSAVRFLVSCKDHLGRWIPIGYVNQSASGRLTVDDKLSGFIPAKTKNRQTLLKSCKFLLDESAANWVEWEPTRKWTTYLTVKTTA